MRDEDKFLFLASTLAGLEKRIGGLEKDKREIVAQLKALKLRGEQRRLVLRVLGESTEDKSTLDDDLDELIRSPYRRNMLAQVRDLLASQPNRAFTATEIKASLGIDASQEKSFYAALAKLHGFGQIRRIGRAIYKTVKPARARL